MSRPPARRDLTRFGYSSSSESDEPPRKTNTTTTGTQNQKKKKKRKPPPQQSINKIWRRFTTKEFTKALAVLPFDPVPLPSTPERPNELLSAGYERARDECSRKVKKIIAECKRVNTRYRDPGFDLDWDLKWLKGNCLNYLGSRRFDLTSSRLSTNTSVPKAVKRVHEIFEKPTFLKDISAGDVKQGALGDCWLIASLSALANVEDGIKRICVEYDTRIGIYGFVFYRDGEWIYSIIDDKLYLTSPCWDSPSMQREMLQQIDRDEPEKVYRKTYQTGSKALFFGQCKDQHETWVALIEKAYAKAHGDYGSLAGGWIGEGLEDLSGGVTTELLASDILDVDAFWEEEICKVNKEFLFGCSTGLLDGGYGDRNGIKEGHAYVVMDARTLKNGQRLVKLRNPWGKTRKGIWEGPWSDGSKEWNNDVKEELGHQFGNDSVFWITYEDMLEKYLHFDRTRLFGDPDWRCCQRWIGVEVPWKAKWNEKFHIKLTKESPLVLVLQQLDDRYYKGLHGQYSFRMHFRVHEQGRPDSEDYIVRSHGNYLMDRSVSIEVPCMEPGNYSIFISVVAERDTDMSSIEDVVKRECKKRVENEKLAQVGYAYDLAHSKGVTHLEQVAKLRKKSDQKKASTSRMQERRKMWEKRHLNRDITKKQTKKNQEKRDKRREADALKRKAIAEELKAKEDAAKAKLEAEAAEKKKQEEAETAEKKKQEETEAAERKKKEEEEEAERKKKEEEKPKDVAVQTDERPSGEDKSIQTEEAKEAKDDAAKSEAADKPKESSEDTPKDGSEDTSKDASKEDKPKEDAPKEESLKEAVKDALKDTLKDALVDAAEEMKSDSSASSSAESADEKDEKDKKSPKKNKKTPCDKEVTEAAAAAAASRQKQSPSPPNYTSEADSSDSPVEDWELLYSSDDMTKKPRMATAPPATTTNDNTVESDGESGMPDPWNAICIVGFRVYSKDEDLDLRVVVEGGDMAENGMGEKGAADIDNAQMNAGGEREKNNKDVTDEVEIVDGEIIHKQKILPDDDNDDQKESEDKTDEKMEEVKDEEKKDEKTVDDDQETPVDKKESDETEEKVDEKKEEEKTEEKSEEKADEKTDELIEEKEGKVEEKKMEKVEDKAEADDDNHKCDDKDDCAKSDTSDSTDDSSSPIPTPDGDGDSMDCSPQYPADKEADPPNEKESST
ncbi:cysteine proteinase [Hypoxylon trugodes]|uniref:cysteine proteinase n=1 Tax=Hypoxylon trugodes TaxID=326681 RepID=UPI0021918F5D|nr:cysteine proteinase [Hypoxylon trugodes]KAI1393796.1 cysteine proteinase [Hypoxylon trugodes]